MTFFCSHRQFSSGTQTDTLTEIKIKTDVNVYRLVNKKQINKKIIYINVGFHRNKIIKESKLD